VIARIVSIVSVPLTLLAIWGLVRQVRKEQRLKIGAPLLGMIMAPVALLVNLVFLRQAFPSLTGPALLVVGLGFGVAWGQTARLRLHDKAVVARRSALHLLFWAGSFLATQLLASFAPARVVAGGLAAMFFSTGSSLGSNLNLLVRGQRLRRRQAGDPAAKGLPAYPPE
jgi:hypothetical protein